MVGEAKKAGLANVLYSFIVLFHESMCGRGVVGYNFLWKHRWISVIGRLKIGLQYNFLFLSVGVLEFGGWLITFGWKQALHKCGVIVSWFSL